jgi:hypothetical protein
MFGVSFYPEGKTETAQVLSKAEQKYWGQRTRM